MVILSFLLDALKGVGEARDAIGVSHSGAVG